MAKKPGGNSNPSGRAEKEVDELLNSLYLPTKIQGQPDNQPLTEQSFFDVWELLLDKNTKELPLLIQGNDSQIVLQASLLRCFNQLLTDRGLGYFDFEDWKTQFESEFSEFTTGASNELKQHWNSAEGKGKKKDDRPKIVELKVNGNKRKSSTYKVVQFFPKRDVKDEWLIFSGSYREIASKIENWWNQKTSGGVVGSLPAKNSVIPLEGQPLVKFSFVEIEPGISKQPLTGEKYIRLMNVTDNPVIASATGLDLISVSDVTKIANAIRLEFGAVEMKTGMKGYIWHKGRTVCNYRGAIARRQGLEGYALVKEEKDGIELFTRILRVVGMKPNLTCFSFNDNYKPSEAFPTAPTQQTVLGKITQTKVKRPIVDVIFKNAVLYLPALGGKPIGLVSGDEVTFDSKRLEF